MLPIPLSRLAPAIAGLSGVKFERPAGSNPTMAGVLFGLAPESAPLDQHLSGVRLAQLLGQIGKERGDLLRLEPGDDLLSPLRPQPAEQSYSPAIVHRRAVKVWLGHGEGACRAANSLVRRALTRLR